MTLGHFIIKQTNEKQNFTTQQVATIVLTDVLVMGLPVYWHSMTGHFRTLLDRIYDSPMKRDLHGKELHFIFQGAGPSRAMLEAGNYTMNIFCQLFGLTYRGMTTSFHDTRTIK